MATTVTPTVMTTLRIERWVEGPERTCGYRAAYACPLAALENPLPLLGRNL